jgi:hypothetical protein
MKTTSIVKHAVSAIGAGFVLVAGAAQAGQAASYQQFLDEITNAPAVSSASVTQSNATSYQQFWDNVAKASVVDNNQTSQPNVPVAKSYQQFWDSIVAAPVSGSDAQAGKTADLSKS